MKCENTSVMLSIKPIAYIHQHFLQRRFGIPPARGGLVDSLQARLFYGRIRMVMYPWN